jgi:hypothetical protein
MNERTREEKRGGEKVGEREKNPMFFILLYYVQLYDVYPFYWLLQKTTFAAVPY